MAERKAVIMKNGRLTVLPDTESLFGRRQKVNLGGSTLTIASGVITVSTSYHKVETQGAAATDDLDTINGGSEGDVLFLSPENNAHTVVVKNGTGNIKVGSGADFTMDDIEDAIALVKIGALWFTLELGG